MAFIPGQGVLGRLTFKDGAAPEYDRTYLVVSVSVDHIEVLNVSSIRGKERKLAYPSNERLRVYCPPFLKPSFVKLDSLTRVDAAEWGTLKLLYRGQPLDKSELARIQSLLKQVEESQ